MKCSVRLPILSAISCFVAILTAGCGGSSSPIELNGNYELTTQSAQPASGIIVPGPRFGGSLTSTAGMVSGTVEVFGQNCFRVLTLTVTGTLKKGALVLNASAPTGAVLTIHATVSPDGSSITTGTYTISGGSGSCANVNGTITGVRIPPLHGTFSGNIISLQGTTINISISVSQGPTADPPGIFPITGSATFSGSSCFTKGTISLAGVVGNVVFVNITTDEKTASTVSAGGDYDPVAKTLSTDYFVNGGGCSGDTGRGTLTFQ